MKKLRISQIRRIEAIAKKMSSRPFKELYAAVLLELKPAKPSRKVVRKYALHAGWLPKVLRADLQRKGLAELVAKDLGKWSGPNSESYPKDWGEIPVRVHPIAALQNHGKMKSHHPHFLAFIGTNTPKPPSKQPPKPPLWLAVAMDHWQQKPEDNDLLEADSIRLSRIDRALKGYHAQLLDLNGRLKRWLAPVYRSRQDIEFFHNPPNDNVVEWLRLAFISAGDKTPANPDRFLWADQIAAEVQDLWRQEIIPLVPPLEPLICPF